MEIKTKYNIGDDVFVMYDKEPAEGIIRGIHTETMDFDSKSVIYYDVFLKYKFDPPANIVSNAGPHIVLEKANAVKEDCVFKNIKKLFNYYYGI